MKRLLVAALLASVPAGALAEGCPPEGGTIVEKVERMNQMVLDQDYPKFVEAIRAEIGIEIKDNMQELAKVYVGGFLGCETIAQRRDLGGMVQNVVLFNGKAGPLFGYWLAVPQGDAHRVISFTLNTNLEKVLANLR